MLEKLKEKLLKLKEKLNMKTLVLGLSVIVIVGGIVGGGYWCLNREKPKGNGEDSNQSTSSVQTSLQDNLCAPSLSQPQKVTNWSSTLGSNLVFVRDKHLWLRNLETDEEQQLTKHSDSDLYDSQPVLSPDNEKIAFIRMFEYKEEKTKEGETIQIDKYFANLCVYQINEAKEILVSEINTGDEWFGSFYADYDSTRKLYLWSSDSQNLYFIDSINAGILKQFSPKANTTNQILEGEEVSQPLQYDRTALTLLMLSKNKNTVIRVNPETKEKENAFSSNTEIKDLSVSQTGEIVYINDAGVNLWNKEQQRLLYEGRAGGVFWNKSGTYILVISYGVETGYEIIDLEGKRLVSLAVPKEEIDLQTDKETNYTGPGAGPAITWKFNIWQGSKAWLTVSRRIVPKDNLSFVHELWRYDLETEKYQYMTDGQSPHLAK